MSRAEQSQPGAGGVAIVAMTGRFPGARDLDTFWRNIRDGVESVRFFTDDELQAAGVPAQVCTHPAYVKARGIVEDADLFDASFFGYSPADALLIDPQQRLFLECAWEALELAGYDPRAFPGLIGVYGGATKSSYDSLLYQTLPSSQLDGLAIALGNDLPYLPTRVSYKLDLNGPSYPVQTACSTSLVAVHLACQGLLNAECDLAIAGGVSVRLPQTSGYRYQEDGIFSPDGRCRPFDARSRGTLFSNGIGIVVLKRLDDALADGDSIRAVIRGSAVNNDGSRRASFTAPGVLGQSNVVADALASAEVAPETIGYVESHGTATQLGDAIEIQALTRAFGGTAAGRQYCAIGSLKANLGHLDAAAGVAGLIKTVLALEHRQVPPMPQFERPNPDIRFEETPFYVNTQLTDWRATDSAPRRAGVSAFGFGGTNAHVVVEEAPELPASGDSRPVQLLQISAETAEGLEAATANLLAHLARHPEISLADAAYTLQVGRRAFRHRRSVVCRTREEAARLVPQRDAASVRTGYCERSDRLVVFRFRGNAAESIGVDPELYGSEPLFRDLVERSVRPPRQAASPPRVAVQFALARLLMAWGVQPAAILAEDGGKEVAARLGGALPVNDLPEGIRQEEPLILDLPSAAQSPAAGNVVDVAGTLGLLATLWLEGVQIDWAGFYANERRYRVPLPTYPFERRSFALPPAGASRAAARTSPPARNPSSDSWCYVPAWTQAPLALPVSSPPAEGEPGVWVVFSHAHRVGQEIAGRLERDGHDVFTVAAGDRFGRPGPRRFTIDPASRSDYERLLEEILEGERPLAGVFHCWSVGPADGAIDGSDDSTVQEQGFGSVLLLTQALGQAGLPPPVRLNLVTSGAHDVVGGEPLSPLSAAVLGLRHVIGQEYPHLLCKAIDLDPLDAGRARGAATLLDRIVHDGTTESATAVVAYRGFSRWTQRFVQLRLPDASGVPGRLRSEGVYLITGGLGAIGLAVAEYLVRTVRARVVLTGRSPLPPEIEWDAYLEAHPARDPIARRVARVRSLRALGGEVLVVVADAADREQMADAFAAADRQFGRIDGVVHAAGLVAGDTFAAISAMTADKWRRQFRPKIGGLAVLDELLRDRDVDFCLLVSSLSAVLGGLGYGAYASANVYLDVFARLRNREGRFPWVSVNWDAWLDPDEDARLRQAGALPSGYVMTAAEGIQVLHRILGADAGPQVIVSTGDLETRIQQWVALRKPATELATANAASVLALPRPQLRTAYVPPNGDLERVITEAFRQALGLAEVGVDDNFFELGGHSLKALEIAARLQTQLGTDVRVTMFYEAPTAALLARAIEARGGGMGHLGDVDRHAENRLERLKLRRRVSPAYLQ